MKHDNLIIPEWPAPQSVRAAISTRVGGMSEGAFASNNLALHVEDSAEAVQHNRLKFAQQASVKDWQWLTQVHGNQVVEAGVGLGPTEADACYTKASGLACAVLTADCLPILLSNMEGTCVAAVHAGWRGLANGIIANVCKLMNSSEHELVAYLGPAIGPENFEVGEIVRDGMHDLAKVQNYSEAWCEAFRAVEGKAGHYMADIYALARWQLAHHQVDKVFGGDFCTVKQSELFYSYRREGKTGRMASAIWIEAPVLE